MEVKKVVAEINTIIELNPELENLACEIGLNPSKICENALKQAIGRLKRLNQNNLMVDEPGFEPGTSTMPTWRSCQTDLLAQIYLASKSYPASFNKRFL
jgi:hypothetical protein